MADDKAESITWAEASKAYFRTLPKLTGSSRQKRRAGLTAVFDVVRELLRREPTLADLRVDVLDFAFSTISSDKTLRATQVRTRLNRAIEFVKFCNQTYGTKVDEQALQGLLERSDRVVAIERNRSEPEELPSTDKLPVGYDAAIIHMPLEKLFHDHYVNDRLLGKSPNSVRLHEYTIRKFGRFLGRRAVIGDLNQKSVSDYLRHLLETTKLQRATIERERVNLAAVWRYCARKRWLPVFPEIQKIDCPERIPDAWSREDLQKLIETCQEQSSMIGNVKASLWWEALIRVIYDSAERIGAVLAIQWDDIDSQGWLTVRAEYRKRKTRDRRYKLRPETLDLLRKLKRTKYHDDDTVFVWPHHRTYIWSHYRKLLVAAGLPTGRRQCFHKIRRTTASEFEAAGGNATELLDHQNRRTTLRYLDPRVIKRVQPADIIPGIGKQIDAAVETGDDSELVEAIRQLVNAERIRRK